MFDFVFPSILGKREFVINLDNYGDAESYLDKIHGELAQVMSAESIKLELSTLSEAFRLALEPVGTPFEKVSQIKVSVSERVPKTTNQNKRIQLYKDEDNYSLTPIQTIPLNLSTPNTKTWDKHICISCKYRVYWY
jgi:hypothetical protein